MAASGQAACMAGWPMFDLAQQDQAGERCEETSQREGADDDAVDGYASQAAGLLVAAGRVDVVAETREAEHDPDGHGHDAVDDRGHRDRTDAAETDEGEIRGQAIDGLGVGGHEQQALDEHLHAQRGHEGVDADLGDEDAVGAADEQADKQPADDAEGDAEVDEGEGRDHRGRSTGSTDREVEAAGDRSSPACPARRCR